MDKLRAIGTFVLVVQNRSFAVAAEQLNVSPSIVSRQIAELEGVLGVRLLARSTRRVDITEIGQQYYEASIRALKEIEAADDLARDMQRTPSGTVTVHASHSFSVLYLGQLISDFGERYPDVQITLVIDEYPAYSIVAAERGPDLTLHLGSLSSERIVAKQLAEVSWHAYASPRYLRTRGVPRSPEDLAQHNCLAHSHMAPDRLWRFQGADGVHEVNVSGSIFSNSVLILRDAVVRGIGIALLPNWTFPGGAVAPLTRLLDRYESPQRNLYLLFTPDRRLPSRVRLFIDFTVAWFSAPPWVKPQ